MFDDACFDSFFLLKNYVSSRLQGYFFLKHSDFIPKIVYYYLLLY